MDILEVAQNSSISSGYQGATGNRCFMFILGAVFAKTSDEAERIATAAFMRGDEASRAYKELCLDYTLAVRRKRVANCHA